jgi:hypothetical protein
MGNSPRTASIHILDDDSLLNVFRLYRPFLLGEDQDDDARLMGGERQWVGEHWWYKPAQVCQRWRNLITGSASHLGLALVCTKGTPVADMLAHSPPFPLVIDYFHDSDITTEDEQGAILALKHRDRIRRVRLHMPVTNLQRLIVTMDEEYLILEYLVIMPRIEDDSMILKFPETLQAPHLRHLALIGFNLPIRSRLLTTAVGLVTLCLVMDHRSSYFHPNTLLQWLSFTPLLETLVIAFRFPIPSRDVERQPTHMPIMTSVLLPNLHCLRFRGISAYLEALVHRITTSRPEKLEIDFFNQLTFSVPRLLQFMNTTENLRFESAKFVFHTKRVDMEVYPHGEAKMYALSITVDCWHLDWQVSSVAQISASLSPLFSAMEHLTLEHEVRGGERDEVDRVEWCRLLGSFRNVKTLRIDDGLVEELSRCLELDDGRLPLWLLPELQELQVENGDTGDGIISFIEARQNVGHPITLVHRNRSLSPAPSSSVISFDHTG